MMNGVEAMARLAGEQVSHIYMSTLKVQYLLSLREK